MPAVTGNVRSWHFCDMPGRMANVRYWGEIGLNADIGIRAAFDRPCVKNPESRIC
jgi:hypothetical protein